MFNVNNKDTRMTTWRRSGVFIVVNFEHILHLCLVFSLLTLSRWMPAGLVLCWATQMRIQNPVKRQTWSHEKNKVLDINLNVPNACSKG